ncbi:MAG: hypothetical protein K9M57_01830 [Phycisphaerae bacterium]|nr:hypothetical protein [Phycisphaerae bacterium]
MKSNKITTRLALTIILTSNLCFAESTKNESKTYQDTCKRLGKLTSREASKQFVATAIKLDKKTQILMDGEMKRITRTGDFPLAKDKEKEFEKIQKEWSALTEEMAIYFADFKPASNSDIIDELIPNLLASINEASTIAEYLCLTYGVSEYLTVKTDILRLKIKLYKVAMKLKVSANGKSNARTLSVEENKINIFSDMYDIDRAMDSVTSKLRKTNKQKYSEGQFRKLLKESYYIRLGAASLYNVPDKRRLCNIMRLTTCIDVCENHILYVYHRTRNKEWIDYGVKTAKLKLAIATANKNLFKKLQRIHDSIKAGK